MEQQVLGLIKLIHKEVDSLESFLRLLSEEQECLVNNRLERLEESISKQEHALIQAKQLESERIRITSWLLKDFKVDTKKGSLSKLIQLLDSSHSSKLEELQKTLLDLHRKVEVQREKRRADKRFDELYRPEHKILGRTPLCILFERAFAQPGKGKTSFSVRQSGVKKSGR